MKIIINIIFILLLSFNFVYGMSEQEQHKRIIGPNSKPNIQGPRQGPPSRKEINKLKYTRDPEFIGRNKINDKSEDSNFFDWLFNFFKSWFN